MNKNISLYRVAALDRLGYFYPVYQLGQNIAVELSDSDIFRCARTFLDDCTQISLLDDGEHDKISIDLESKIKRLTARFGKLEVENAGVLGK